MKHIRFSNLRPKTQKEEWWFALVFVGIAAVLHWALRDLLENRVFFFFYPVVFIVSLNTRKKVGVVTVIFTSLFIGLFLLHLHLPVSFSDLGPWFQEIAFLLLGLAFVFYSGKSEKDRAEKLLIQFNQNEKLRHENASIHHKLELFVKHVPVRIVMLDRELRVLVASELWKEAYFPGPEAVEGKPYFELFPYLSEKWKDRYRKCAQGQAIEPKEECVETGPEKGRWLSWELHPFKEERGEISGVVVTVRDMSEQKWSEISIGNSEAGYRRLAQTLDDRVKERIQDISDRDEKLRLALEASQSGMGFLDVSKMEVTFDERMHEIVGKAHDYVPKDISRFIDEVIHVDDRKSVFELLQATIEKGQEFEIEWRTVGGNKGIRTVLSRGKAYRSQESGSVTGIAAVSWDISERKISEANRLKAETKFRMILESAPDAMILVDGEGAITHLNAQGEKLFGFGREELLGEKIEKLIPPESLEHHVYKRQKYMRAPTVLGMGGGRELTALTKDGRRIPVEICLSPGEVEGETFVICSVRDVSDRQAKDARIRMLAAVVESSQDFVGICAPDMHPLFVNEAGRKMVGLSPDERIEKHPILDYFWPEDRKLIQEVAIPELMKTDRWYGECRFLNFSTGEPINTIWNAFVIRDEVGKQIGWGTVSPNLTKLKEKENALRSALQEKEVLLREIHHRVKNNLNIVSSLLELQACRTDDPLTATNLRESKQRIATMALIHEKLYQSKSLANIDFQQYVTELVSFLYQSYGKDQKQFPATIEVDPIVFGVDTAIPCGLIINELVSNVLKYAFTHRADGHVSIRLHPNPEKAQDRALYELQISDDGIGVPPSFKIEGGKTLGIKIVQTLARQMGGNVSVDRNRVDGGTNFKIHFGRDEGTGAHV